MGDRYNLYESLKLDSAASTEELHANLSSQLSELRDAGVSEYSGEFQEKLTALQVLGDEGRRREYDALLADENATITIATLRGLANRPVPTAQESSFQTQAQQAQSQPSSAQQNQQAQWSAPTQNGPATVTTTVTTDVPPLPANATLQNMWQRMPLIPRITTGLVGFSTLIGIITVLYAIKLSIQGANNLGSLESSLGDSWEGIGYMMGAAAALVLVPILLLLGMMLVTLTAYWIHSILRGEDSTAPIFFCVTVAPLALTMTIIPPPVLELLGGCSPLPRRCHADRRLRSYVPQGHARMVPRPETGQDYPVSPGAGICAAAPPVSEHSGLPVRPEQSSEQYAELTKLS